MVFFVPFGYLLPYTFRWFRERVRTRPVGVCFLISFFTENMQLMSQRGLYDLDDMISNSLGGLIGQLLYISFAYVVTHPDWKRDLRSTRYWRKRARNSVLYRSRGQIAANCTVLLASDREAVWDFYVRKLGYRPLRRTEEDGEEVLLLSLGQSLLRFRCGAGLSPMPEQALRIRAAGLPAIRARLQEAGIDNGEYEEDPYTGQRELRFTGPDNVQITITEVD